MNAPTADAVIVTAAAATQPAAPTRWLSVPSHWPGQTDLLQWAANMSPGEATVLVILGLVYLAYGWKAFKGLVTLNAAFVGAVHGALIGHRAGNWVGGACVAHVHDGRPRLPHDEVRRRADGRRVRRAPRRLDLARVGLEPNLAWAGAMTGLVAFGLLSFIVFRGSVIMYTSLQGSVMLIFGLLGLVFKYQSLAPEVSRHLALKRLMLPIAILIPALLGLIYQQTANPRHTEGKKK